MEDNDPRVIKYAIDHIDEILADLKKEGWFAGEDGKFTLTEKGKESCRNGR